MLDGREIPDYHATDVESDEAELIVLDGPELSVRKNTKLRNTVF